jgi:hypothetical protein
MSALHPLAAIFLLTTGCTAPIEEDADRNLLLDRQPSPIERLETDSESLFSWVGSGSSQESGVGYSVTGVGDLNGDGFGDFAAGAPLASGGSVLVYLGTSTGPAASPDWILEESGSSFFGVSVAGAGDINGDGYSDLVIGAYRSSNGEFEEGKAFVYLGSASGLSTTSAWTAESNQTSSWYGSSVAGAGDLNRDGYDDLVVGARNYDNGQSNEGAAFVYLGSASGPSTSVDWILESDVGSSYFGSSVAGAGDINGDGYSDLLVSAFNYNGEGAAFVYTGSASGVSSTPAWISPSNPLNFGASAAGAGDINGDGYSDIVVGVYGYSNGESFEGAVSVYTGSAAGLSSTPVWSIESNQTMAYLGFSVAGAGDTNGDGYSDILVGAYQYDNLELNEGGFFLYLGSSAGLQSNASQVEYANTPGAWLGYSVAGAGDVNGDGFDDILAGAPYYALYGAAFLYTGAASTLASTPSYTVEINELGAHHGFSVAGAGDVNGDGFNDLIVGAVNAQNGQNNEGRAYVYLGTPEGLDTTATWSYEPNLGHAYFGYSVDGAGDVNVDGYADIIVGEPYGENGEGNEGRAYVFLGSSSGIALTPCWSAEANDSLANFGWSVAGAGDVNGDGFDDIIASSPWYDFTNNNSGRAFVYLGSTTGPSPTEDWVVDGEQDNEYLGNSVAGAGDVNGDGRAYA